MGDSPDAKRQNMHHMPMSCESPLEKRLSSMPPEEIEPQNMSYLGNYPDNFPFYRLYIDNVQLELELQIFQLTKKTSLRGFET